MFMQMWFVVKMYMYWKKMREREKIIEMVVFGSNSEMSRWHGSKSNSGECLGGWKHVYRFFARICSQLPTGKWWAEEDLWLLKSWILQCMGQIAFGCVVGFADECLCNPSPFLLALRVSDVATLNPLFFVFPHYHTIPNYFNGILWGYPLLLKGQTLGY